jgi:hypothetical protein
MGRKPLGSKKIARHCIRDTQECRFNHAQPLHFLRLYYYRTRCNGSGGRFVVKHTLKLTIQLIHVVIQYELQEMALTVVLWYMIG